MQEFVLWVFLKRVHRFADQQIEMFFGTWCEFWPETWRIHGSKKLREFQIMFILFWRFKVWLILINGFWNLLWIILNCKNIFLVFWKYLTIHEWIQILISANFYACKSNINKVFKGLTLNSFMMEVPNILKPVHWLICKSMGWFLYDRNLRHEKS